MNVNNMNTNNKKKNLETFAVVAAIFFLALVEFILHRKITFMMDDNWYSTNLATGTPLTCFKDILESQVWHFNNWGGRVITHGLLQLTLMAGEFFCDILNILMTLCLTLMLCVITRQCRPFWFLTGLTLLTALNANIKMSMYWQSGTANYVYATTWILVYLWVYLRQLQTPAVKPLPLVNLWMPLLGLITGWSNENMGPASFLLSVAVMLYLFKTAGQKPALWAITGSLTCLIGSCLVILAPGNFVRVSNLDKMGPGETIYNRILSMLCAGTDFLFPAALLLVLLLLIYTSLLGERLQALHWFLLGHAILSYGAMVLSPHYPDRATFGTLAVCICLMISIMADIVKKHPAWKKYFFLLIGCLWIYSLYTISLEIYGTLFL